VNKEFVKKMIKAERLRYEAFKEILPHSIKERVDTLEKDAVNFLKDIAIEIIKEDWVENKEEIMDYRNK
jgi:lipoate-protein ligase A